MSKISAVLGCLWLFLVGVASSAQAHFGVIIPERSMIMNKNEAKVAFDVAFSHPFSGSGMDMEQPVQFIVSSGEQSADLANSLEPATFMNHGAWKIIQDISRPGVYQFAAVPRPYYESAEDRFIIHYAKTIIGAYGAEDGWEKPMGLPMEIVPLTRPFGNYAGNIFTGRALLNGKPLPNAPIEVEYLNLDGSRAAPNPYFETQTLVADENGVFSFGIPWAGWWGFAALADSPLKIKMDNKERDVELGGVIWTEFTQPAPVSR